MGSILVIRGGAIGDFILTLPAIRLLRESLPDAEIEIMGYRSIIELARCSGYAERTRSIEYGAMASFFAPNAKLDEGLCAYFASFDVVVSFLYDPDHFFRDNLRRAPVETLLECSHRIDNEGEPAPFQLAKPLQDLALYLDESNSAPLISFRAEDELAADRFLGAFSARHAAVVAVHPGSGSPFKNWDLKNWAALLQRLYERQPETGFVVATGEAEEESVRAFLREIGELEFPMLHADSLPLPTLGAVLGRCDGFIGHDSGISHLAAAAGTRSTVLFGPTQSKVWAPQNDHVTVVEHASGLLSEVTVEDVLAAVSALH